MDMEKSVRLICGALGMTAVEMNAQLCEHGYLDGSPGDYSITDKGKQYGSEKDHHRGNGGYAHYNRQWTTRTWDEERIVSALAADMAAAQAHRPDTADQDEPVNKATTGPVGEGQRGNVPGRSPWVAAAAIGGAAAALVGGVLVVRSPRVHRWVGENVTPRTQKVWRTLTNSAPSETPAHHDNHVPSDVVELPAPAAQDEIDQREGPSAS